MIIPTIEQFIPILLLILYLLFPVPFILQSNTILGKLFAIFIIVVYTNIHFTYGLIVCLLIIFYYQCDYIDNIIQSENFQPKTRESMVEQRNSVMTSSSISEDKLVSSNIDDLLEVNKAYNANKKLPIQSESKAIFRNQQCNPNLELVYKNQIIYENDTIPCIFQEIQFIDDNKPCNPCDPSCPFSIKSSLEKKEWIGQSTRGKTSLEEAMDWANSFFVNKNEPFSGVDLNIASYL